MDERARELERAVQQDDPRALDAYGQSQIRAGNFWAKQITDEYLGSAWQLSNLNVDGEIWNLIYGKSFMHDFADQTIDNYLARSLCSEEHTPGGKKLCSMLVQSSIDLAMFEHRNHPHRAPIFEKYLAYRRDNRTHLATGKLTYHSSGCATLEDISLDGTLNTRDMPAVPISEHVLVASPYIEQEQIGRLASSILTGILPLLTELFGRDYHRTLPALQYCARPNYNGSLREVRLLLPDQAEQTLIPQNALYTEVTNVSRLFIAASNARIAMSAAAIRDAKRVS